MLALRADGCVLDAGVTVVTEAGRPSGGSRGCCSASVVVAPEVRFHRCIDGRRAREARRPQRTDSAVGAESLTTQWRKAGEERECRHRAVDGALHFPPHASRCRPSS